MISYYELAKLIKEGKQPKKIRHLGKVYEFENELYVTPEKSYKVALGGLENEINIFANIFNENIEIIEEIEKSKEIEKIDVFVWDKCVHGVTREEKETRIEIYKIQMKINEIIDAVNHLL